MVLIQVHILKALEAFEASANAQPLKNEIKGLIKRVKAATMLESTDVRYKCPECETLLDEGERRCDSCNKFGSRVEVLLVCPHCDEPVTEEDLG